MGPVLKVSGISKQFKEHRALDDISFEVYKGKKVIYGDMQLIGNNLRFEFKEIRLAAIARPFTYPGNTRRPDFVARYFCQYCERRLKR